MPEKSRLYPIVYISLLKPALDTARLATNNIEMEGEESTFKVEEILDLEQMNQQVKYLVKWEGYPYLENT